MEEYSDQYLKVNQKLEKYIIEYEKPNKFGYDENTMNKPTLPKRKNKQDIPNGYATGKMFALGQSDFYTYVLKGREHNEGYNCWKTGQLFWLSSSEKGDDIAVGVTELSHLEGSAQIDFTSYGARGAFFVNLDN